MNLSNIYHLRATDEEAYYMNIRSCLQLNLTFHGQSNHSCVKYGFYFNTSNISLILPKREELFNTYSSIQFKHI